MKIAPDHLLCYHKYMEGWKNDKEQEMSREQKRVYISSIKDQATKSFLDRDSGPYNKIVEFVTNFRQTHPDANKYVLLHELIGSSLGDEEYESNPLDTEDGEILKFAQELEKEL